MKNLWKGLAVTSLAVVLGVGAVNAKTVSRSINTRSCEGPVYTNYYMFLEANTTGYFGNSPLSNISNSAVGRFENNQYRVEFDSSNIGYGQVALDKYTITSRDGITSMSLNDFYNAYRRAGSGNGTYKDSYKMFISTHNWNPVNNNGSWSNTEGSMDLSNYSTNALIAATLEANTEITPQSSVSYYYTNPFNIRVDRNFKGSLTGTPLSYGQNNWYLHPAVYYIQYCSNGSNSYRNTYTITYRAKTNDVLGIPGSSTIDSNENAYISDITPTRAGYTFLGWTTDSNAYQADARFSAGSLYTDRKDLVLYAVWGSNNGGNNNNNDGNTNLPENPKTGLTDYLLPTVGVIATSGTGLGFLKKKKKSFRQF